MHTDDTGLFESILSPRIGPGIPQQREDTLHDLALDQAFTEIGDGAPHADSAFRTLLRTVPEVEYRQAVFRGLENSSLRTVVDTFLQGIALCKQRDVRGQKASHPYQAKLWHLSAATVYIRALKAFDAGLTRVLPSLEHSSHGWEQLSRHVAQYCSSQTFISLESAAVKVQDKFTDLQFNMLIRGGKITVAQTDDESDLAESVLETYDRFRQEPVIDHRTTFRPPQFDHVQGWILDRVALVHPDTFALLVEFGNETPQYRDQILDLFADEVRFYLAYLDYLAPLRGAGLSVCYPQVSATSKELAVTATWDISLAKHLVDEHQPVVTNDLSLTEDERILVISGPNQGGKTTAARVFGQLHHLAAIGCPVPGTTAQIFLCDQVLTVFEREEKLETLEGRLGAEVLLLHAIFQKMTARTVLVINEAFGSTSLQDAAILTRDLLERISDLGALAVCVTFIDELSRLNEKTVSMVSTVDPSSPEIRTFRIERRVADGRAYAQSLAAKHGLTSEQIRRNLQNMESSS